MKKNIPKLLFESKELEKSLKQSDAPIDRKWLGAKHHREIREGMIAPITIKKAGVGKGLGAFAAEDLPAGTFLGEYIGIVRKWNILFGKLNAYCFRYPVKGWFWHYNIDASSKGNDTRYINHSVTPNTLARAAFLDGYYHMIFLTLKPIKAGEEITYNYGRGTKQQFPFN